MNQFDIIHQQSDRSSQAGVSAETAAAVDHDELHALAMWIVSVGRMLNSQYRESVPGRWKSCTDNFRHPHSEPAYAEAWRTIVPTLTEAARSPDPGTRNPALVLLGLLGPEAAGPLQDLALCSKPRMRPGGKPWRRRSRRSTAWRS